MKSPEASESDTKWWQAAVSMEMEPQHQEQGGNAGFSSTGGTGMRLQNTMFTGCLTVE